jgi:hypothetical protein
VPASRRTISSEQPASSGVHGPGDKTIAVGESAATSAALVASFRTTRVAWPNRSK